MLAFLEGPDLFIVLAIVLLVFGGSQLPKLARSLGEAQREFKKGIAEGGKDEPSPAKPTETRSETPAPEKAPDQPSGDSSP